MNPTNEPLTITVSMTSVVPRLVAEYAEVGEWMLATALRVWMTYDEEGTFMYIKHDNGSVTITDEDEGKSLTISPFDFFVKHAELIWLATIEGYRHDWIDFAFKSKGAEPDEYDDNTCDAVLQTLLYGEVVYG